MTDPVLVVLGGAVVKTAVRLWVGPNVLADNLTADLTGLLESRVSDAGERRKLRRRFEEMEDIVADQVMAALDTEFRGLDEGERNAAVGAVTETFNRARVTSGELFSRDLDPLNLEKYVRNSTGDATRDLSWGGIQLYDRVLARCCAYILEIADKLPRFQTGAFAELLKRDSQILARLEDVLARLPEPATDGSAADRVETAYRQRIVKVFDRLELFGLDFAAQYYSLSIAYVNLRVSTERSASNAELPDNGATDRWDESLERWLVECPRLLIEGRAGSGKTTILQWIAVRAARRDFDGAASAFNGYVPFFVRLRDYAGSELPQPEDFLGKIAPLLAPEAAGWSREQLRSGRALVLVDGVDEVPEVKRPEVVAWLDGLTELFPDARYVVTTRPGAMEDTSVAEVGFVQADLEAMEPTLIRIFIDRWHAAMREWQKDNESLARLTNCRDELVNVLDHDRFLGELANTPLLAGLICALNHHLNAQLPRRRGEIFEKALAMFHERDRKRRIAAEVTLDLDATNHLLGDLALWMVRNARVEVEAGSMVAANSARNILRQSALSLASRPKDTADLYGHLLLRSGVLREPTADHVDFVHRTFQEYLAAKALIRTDNVGELVRNAGDDQWREVVILAAGRGNTRQTSELLRGLLKRDWRGRNRYRRRMLAVACLDEVRGADPSVLEEIDHVIPDLLPPRSVEQAEALSHAGERLIPHLERTAKFSNPMDVLPVIRAAALIGGPDAFDLVKKLAAQFRSRFGSPYGYESTAISSLAEFARAWQYFEPEAFAREVLNPLRFSAADVTEERLFQQIAKVPTITRLTLVSFLKEETDLSSLDALELQWLTINDSSIRSLSGVLRPWKSIRRIELKSCPRLADISALSMFPDLQELHILYCSGIKVYSVLSSLKNLRTLWLQGQKSVDLAPVADIPDLRELRLAFMPSIDLRPLSGKPLRISLNHISEKTYPSSMEGQSYHIYDGSLKTTLTGQELAEEVSHGAIK